MAASLVTSIVSDIDTAKPTFRPALGRGGLGCWIALPNPADLGQPPLVAVHGIRRNAHQQAALFAERANALGRTVIAPLFSLEDWPRYQQAVRPARADRALIALMATLRADGLWHTSQFDLFGFSGGAQFAHRFAMMHPQLVCRLTVASAGWYTFPDASRFPYGLSACTNKPDPWSAVTHETVVRFLTIPTQVCVGTDDTSRDANLRSGERIDAQQGKNRLARSIRWTQALQQAAKERGLPPRATFVALSGCDHDFRQCVIRGGLDQIVIPDDNARQPGAGLRGGACALSDVPSNVGIKVLRPAP